MRKDRLISFCACTVPVSITTLSAARDATVTVRTGRTSGGGASTSRAQPASKAISGSATQASVRNPRSFGV